ncbi:MAG: hypothetical protein J5929_01235 [Eubacterium sp.]|nr:hypothetical protein [Eubacterium sp.]
MGNNRRLYKRIIAIMLVVLLVLPHGISSLVTNASEIEGMIVSAPVLSRAEGGYTASVTIESTIEGTDLSSGYTLDFYIDGNSTSIGSATIVTDEADSKKGTATSSVLTASISKNDSVKAVLTDSSGDTAVSGLTQSTFNYPPAPVVLNSDAPTVDANSGVISVSVNNEDSLTTISDCTYTVSFTDINGATNSASGNVTTVNGSTASFTLTGNDKDRLKTDDYTVTVTQGTVTATVTEKNNLTIDISKDSGVQEVLLDNASVGSSVKINKYNNYVFTLKASPDNPLFKSVTLGGITPSYSEDASGRFQIATLNVTAGSITLDSTLSATTKKGTMGIELNFGAETFYPGYKYTVTPTIKDKNPSNVDVTGINLTISSEGTFIGAGDDGSITVNSGEAATLLIDPDATGSFEITASIVGNTSVSPVSVQKDLTILQDLSLKYFDKETGKNPVDLVDGYLNKDFIVKIDDTNGKYNYYKITSDSSSAWTPIPNDKTLTTCHADDDDTQKYTLSFKSYFDKDDGVNNQNNHDMNTKEITVGVDKTDPSFIGFTIKSFTGDTVTSTVEYDENGDKVDPDAENNASASKRELSINWKDDVSKGKVEYYDQNGTKIKDVSGDKIVFVDEMDTQTFVIRIYDKVGNYSEESIEVPGIAVLTMSDVTYTSKRTYDEGENSTVYMQVGEKAEFYIKGYLTEDIKQGVLEAEVVSSPEAGVTIDASADIDDGLGQKRTYTITPTKDGTYTITYKFKDDSITKPIEGTINIVVDSVKPIIKFDDRINAEQSSQQIINTGNPSLQIVKTVTDEKSGLKKYSCTVSKADKADGTKDLLSDYGEDFNGELSFTDNNNVPEGRYIVTYKAEDRSGNITTIKKDIIFDITKPNSTGAVSVSANNKRNYSDYQYFDTKAIDVSVDVEDKESGIDKVSVIQDNVTIPSTFETSVDGNGNSTKSVKFSIPITYKGFINLELVDIAGNKKTVRLNTNDFAGIVAEDGSAKNSISIEATKVESKYYSDENKQYYNKDDSPKVTYDAQDDISGLYKVTLYGDGDTKNTKIDENNYYDEKSSKEIKLNDNGSWDFTAYANKEEEKEYSLKAFLEDNAGNIIGSNTVNAVVDNIAPEISVTFNGLATPAETYNNDVTVNVTVTETYFRDGEVIIYDGNEVYKTLTSSDFTTSNGVSTCSYTISKDSSDKYWVTVSASDKANNQKSYSSTSNRFILDKTSPRLNLTFNNNDVRNGKYYKAARTGTLTVEEHNFDASKVTVTVRVSDSAPGVGTPSNSGFSTSGDTHTSTIPFTQDATYEITVTAQDQAGNSADRTITESFVVDLTAPEIKISNVEQNKLYSGTVRPDIEVTDRNYEAKGTKITLESSRDGGAAAKSLAESYSTTSVANGERFTYTNFKKEEDKDDYYSVKAVAEDLAGNTSEETVGFMVDRFGSYYTLNGYTEGLVKAVYTNLEGDDEIVIEAHNLADIDESTVYFTVGEDTKTLKENEGYTVSEDKGSDHWNVSTYTFDKSLFDAEGEYNIVVSTKDSEGNVADNETKDAPVKFVIDRTAPEFVISGIEDGHDYEDQKSVSGNIEIHDNIGVSKAVITLDGEAQTYEAKDLEAMNNTVPVEFTKGAHSIEVKVVDLAGNESADDKGISFTVDQSAIERAAWWIFIVIGVIVVGGIVFFVVRRRNNA